MPDFDAGGTEQIMTLDGGEMSKMLRWAVHTLEISMWAEDYALDPSRSSIPLYYELLLEYRPDDWMDEEEEPDEDPLDEDEDIPEREVRWQVQIEYADHVEQEIVSYQAYLSGMPGELHLALLEYFVSETGDFDAEYNDEGPSA